ncbi:NAD(P)/FAD-dependent oxidoreductase [Desulfotomaculum copahuensis]|uniref:Dehydrogenase n=1 Tax=Desulfotomaculum copahuensis TaxID=1838280 RepID=A0A1B7LHD0_9FIRM|nr:NAD(P)/FAD-dependent oxidoreductase [Desulfotomaculum copahuensis]OAT85603.1 hypothetical protein A6M21_05675 [Desulfotomaculum copahuensis]
MEQEANKISLKPGVAIIGAGISGLSCAHELERLGCRPVLFDISRSVGHPFAHCGAVLEILYRSVSTRDLLELTREDYNISLIPLNPVKNIIMVTANQQVAVDGKLGYIFARGQVENSAEKQIARQLATTCFQFDRRVRWQDLIDSYDYVVVADAGETAAKELASWHDMLRVSIMGGVVLGSFDACTLYMWLNESYAGKGWAYLAPYNNRRASLVLSVPNVRPEEMRLYWEKFFQTEGFDFTVAETFQTTLAVGAVQPCRVGRVFLTGVAGGFIDPLLGMGVLPGVASGVLAARSIVRGLDYEKETAFLVKLIKKADHLRRTLDKLNNAGMDRLVGLLGCPPVKSLIYHTKLDVVDLAELVLKRFY